MSDEEQTARDLPGTLDVSRDRDLLGRTHHVWLRRAALAALTALVVAALFSVFGQVPNTVAGRGGGATLELSSPTRLRGGLIYQTRFTLSSSRRLRDAVLVLSPDWFESTTLNSTEPQPTAESGVPGGVRFSYGSLAPGQTRTVWMQWSVNPTNVGSRDWTATLYDGDTALTSVHRDVTIFP